MEGRKEALSTIAAEVSQKVVEQGIPLSQIEIEVAGPELRLLLGLIKARAITAFSNIKVACQTRGHQVILSALRSRMSALFEIPEWKLDPSSDDESVGISTVPRTLSGQLLTQDRADRELLLLGHVYVFQPNGDFMQQTKIAIERVFIAQCQNVDQQRQILDIVAKISYKDLIYEESVGGLALFSLNSDIFRELSVVSMLSPEERQTIPPYGQRATSQSTQMRSPSAPSGQIEAVTKPPRRGLSDQKIQEIELEWEDLGWNNND